MLRFPRGLKLLARLREGDLDLDSERERERLRERRLLSENLVDTSSTVALRVSVRM